MIVRPPDVHGAAYDLLVVGGTLFACALAREAAAAGARVLLVAPGDLGAGERPLGWLPAAFAPDFDATGLAEVLAERELLLRAAPHRVRPVRAIVVDAGPSPSAAGPRRRLLRLAAAVPRSTLPPPQSLAPGAAAAAWPSASADCVGSAALAFDARLDAAGLARCCARDAVAAGAAVWTHAAIVRAGVDGIEAHAPWCGRRAIVRAARTVATEAFAAVAASFHVDPGAISPRRVAVVTSPFAPLAETARIALGAHGVLAVGAGPAPTIGRWRGRPGDETPADCLGDVPGLGLDDRSLRAAVDDDVAIPLREEGTVAGPLAFKAPSPLRALSAARALLARWFPGAGAAAPRAIAGGAGPRAPLEPLWQRHGSDAAVIARLAAAGAPAREPVCPHDGVLAAEVEHALALDGATCFVDVVRRLFADVACRDPGCLRRAHAAYLRCAGVVADAEVGAATAAALAAIAPTGAPAP